jgi:hypothetical protein
MPTIRAEPSKPLETERPGRGAPSVRREKKAAGEAAVATAFACLRTMWRNI